MGTIVGAIAGFLVGWLIAALSTKFTDLGGGRGMFEGPGCLVTVAQEYRVTLVRGGRFAAFGPAPDGLWGGLWGQAGIRC